MTNNASTNKLLSTKSAVIYGFGIFGMQLLIGLVNTYQSQFYTSILGANLMIIAVIILVAKLLSALIDPFIGSVIDRSNFKSGKMRPFILMSALPFAVLTTLLFITINFKTSAGMYVYVTATTVLWNIAMSFADIPSQGMLALLSPIAEERNVAAGITNTLKSIALAAPGVVMPVICVLTKSEGGAIGSKEYLIAAIFMCLLGVALYVLIYFCNKEAVKSTPHKMTLKDIFKELTTNKMLLIVFMTFMLGFGRNMAMGIGVQAGATLLRDGLNFGGQHMPGENLAWLLGTTSATTAMISIIITPMINKKWGEKKTFIVFAIYGFIISTLAFILYATGSTILRSLWAIMAYQLFVGFMYGPHGYLPMIMVSDIVDQREVETGIRTEGIQFAVLSLSNKISNALSVAVGIFIVGASGYYGGIAPEGITRNMQTIVFLAYIGIPGFCCLLSMIPMFFYKINAKTREQARIILEQRRTEQAQEAEIQQIES